MVEGFEKFGSFAAGAVGDMRSIEEQIAAVEAALDADERAKVAKALDGLAAKAQAAGDLLGQPGKEA